METATEQLVWAHAHAPEGARAVAMEDVVANGRAIQRDAANTVALLQALPSDISVAFFAAMNS